MQHATNIQYIYNTYTIYQPGEFSTKRVRVTPTWMDATLASAPKVGVPAPEGEYLKNTI